MNGVLINGRPGADMLAHSRGLHYGDGVFRTVLVHHGLPLDWDLQILKLRMDCEALQLQMPAADVLTTELGKLEAPAESWVLKIILSRRSGGRGYLSNDTECERLLLSYPAPQFPEDFWLRGIGAFRSPIELAAQPALAGIKHLNRLEQVLASRDWPAEMSEAVVCNQRGQPVCGSRSNLFWSRHGSLFTPALDECGVSGMMRAKVIALSSALKVKMDVGTCAWQELEEAEEVFVTNSLIGIWPVQSLGHRSWTAPGPITRRLMQALAHPRLC